MSRRYEIGPLVALVFAKDLDGLREALCAGADPNERDTDGRTPLIHASSDSHVELVWVLLEAGADVNIRDGWGWAALHFAAQNFHIKVAQLLLSRGASTEVEDEHGNTPLSTAVFNSKGRGEMIRVLRDLGADPMHPNKYGVTPLSLARTIANYDVAQFFADLP